MWPQRPSHSPPTMCHWGVCMGGEGTTCHRGRGWHTRGGTKRVLQGVSHVSGVVVHVVRGGGWLMSGESGQWALWRINPNKCTSCVHQMAKVLTELTKSFQSLMSCSLRLLLSSYSVSANTAPAPHRSSSLSASLIVTSPCALWFSS